MDYATITKCPFNEYVAKKQLWHISWEILWC